MNDLNKRYLIAALILISFYACISVACYSTSSAWPLLALLVTPEINIKL